MGYTCRASLVAMVGGKTSGIDQTGPLDAHRLHRRPLFVDRLWGLGLSLDLLWGRKRRVGHKLFGDSLDGNPGAISKD